MVESLATELGEQAQALLDPTRPLPMSFAGFTLLSRMSHSRFGAVVDGIAPSGDRVALKIAPVSHVSDESAVTALLDELQEIAKRRDRGLVELVDVGVSEGVLYVALRRVDGFLLSDLADGSLPIAAIVSVGVDVLQTVGRVKHVGLNPRALTPDSVIIDDVGRAMIADFASRMPMEASFEEEDDARTVIAPEPQAEIPSESALQFGVGALLWETMAGDRTRVDSGTRAGWRGATGHEPDVDAIPKRCVPLLPAVTKMLALDPADRFASLNEASIALCLALEGAVSEISNVSSGGSLPVTVIDGPQDPLASSASWILSDVRSPTARAGYVLLRLPVWEKARIVKRLCARVLGAEQESNDLAEQGAQSDITKPPSFLPLGVSQASAPVARPSSEVLPQHKARTRSAHPVRGDRPLRALGISSVIGMAIGLIFAFGLNAFRERRRPIKFAEVRPYLELVPDVATGLVHGPADPTRAQQESARARLSNAEAFLRQRDLDQALEEAEACISLADLRRCHELTVMMTAIRGDRRASAHAAYLRKLSKQK